MDNELERILYVIDNNLKGMEAYAFCIESMDDIQQSNLYLHYYIYDFIIAVRALRDKLENG